MRAETIAKLIFYGLIALALYATFARLAHSGADIPPYPPPIVGVDTVAVRNPSVVLIYTASKQYRNDRVFLSQFEVAK